MDRDKGLYEIDLEELSDIMSIEDTFDGILCMRSTDKNIIDSLTSGLSMGFYNADFELIGYVLVRQKIDNTIFIEKIWVSKECRGLGVSKILLNYIIEKFSENVNGIVTYIISFL